MPCRLSFRSAGFLVLLVGCLSFSNAAWAGFQWIAPTEPPPPANDMLVVPTPSQQSNSLSIPAAPMSSSGLQSTSPEVISPLVIEGSGASRTSSLGTMPADSSAYNGAPVELRPSQPALPVTGASETSRTAGSEEIVHGFAKSVPLAVALRQILPLGYTFSIDQGVDMGTTVSFQGGRPWRETLREMLVPAGLVMREKGQTVAIGYKMDTLPVVASPAQPAARIPAASSQVTVFPQAIAASGVSVSVPASPPVTNGTWSGEHGDSLHKVLEEWCQRAHVELDWLSEYDYPLEASVSFNGAFEDAVRTILAGFEGAHPQPVAELHSNARAGQKVLVVQARGNTNGD
jgi:Toxin co-regulated pilus biosynthesis protein Q